MMFSRVGAYARAIEAWAALRDVMPDYQEAYRRGADALRRAGQGEQADALTEEARRRFEPNEPRRFGGVPAGMNGGPAVVNS